MWRYVALCGAEWSRVPCAMWRGVAWRGVAWRGVQELSNQNLPSNPDLTHLVLLSVLLKPFEVAFLGIPRQLAQSHIEEAGVASAWGVPV